MITDESPPYDELVRLYNEVYWQREELLTALGAMLACANDTQADYLGWGQAIEMAEAAIASVEGEE